MSKLYKIKFIGVFPIGAGAIAIAANSEEARLLFIQELCRSEPHLVDKNLAKDAIEVTELSEVSTCCHIITNGDY